MLAGDAHHAYQDKYCLTEWLTNTALAATLNCLEVIGLDNEKLAQLKAASELEARSSGTGTVFHKGR